MIIKSHFFLILATFVSCTHSTSWTLYELKGRTSTSVTLQYLPKDDLKGVQLQLIQGEFGIVAYVNVTSREILPLKENEKYSRVTLLIDQKPHPFSALRMEGNQRLLLPEEATKLLLEALHSEQTVAIALQGYFSEISKGEFVHFYKKAQKNFL